MLDMKLVNGAAASPLSFTIMGNDDQMTHVLSSYHPITPYHQADSSTERLRCHATLDPQPRLIYV